MIQKQCEESLATVEAKKEAEDAWRKHCLDLASKTLAIHTNSWYMGAKSVDLEKFAPSSKGLTLGW